MFEYPLLTSNSALKTPNMGPAPSPSGKLKWRSLITLEGGPIEYSWKWPTRTSEPDIRYSLEPINQYSGTAEDPLNQRPAGQMLHRLAAEMPEVDLSWTNHFLATLFDHDKSKYVEEAALTGVPTSSTFGMAAEFVAKGLGLKAYFVPRKIGHLPVPPLEHWVSSMKQLHQENLSRDVLLDFLASSQEGKLFNPLLVAVDCVAPAKSRLKWYFQTPSCSFSSVCEVMTLGGRRPNMSAQLAELRDLIHAVLSLPADFPDDADVPQAPQYNPDNNENDNFVALPGLLTGFIYYFDIPPGATLPEVKLYIPVWRYGRDDLSVARGTMNWMEARSRGEYSQRFLSMLESMAEHRALDDGLGLQTYVSCVLKGNEPDITTYMGAELLHPLRRAASGAA